MDGTHAESQKKARQPRVSWFVVGFLVLPLALVWALAASIAASSREWRTVGRRRTLARS